MKRFFSCLLALLSMIGVANAQRVWAYALQVEEMEGDHPVYNFTFIATADATSANLVFTDEDGNETTEKVRKFFKEKSLNETKKDID